MKLLNSAAACVCSAACLNYVVRNKSAQICSLSSIHVHCCIGKLCLGKSNLYPVPELNLGRDNCQVYKIQKHKYLSTFACKVFKRNLDSGPYMKGENLLLPTYESVCEF